MKKLVIIALVLVTATGFAQRKDRKNNDKGTRSEMRETMSAKDIADLKSKKLTLKLDLTEAQQSKVQKVIFKQAEANEKLRAAHKAARAEGKQKPTAEERVARENHRLDQMIAMKREMKSILTEEQYAKFEKMKPQRDQKRRKHNGDRKDRGDRK
ncbi:hypothetical protein [Winogradskyella rapida]|uniref:Spy/CpxP family protein refolding chaperone n=1 Tax=Winogradskyella rapida TaxID=549701 RepID=A0ABW3KWR8_9FLAO